MHGVCSGLAVVTVLCKGLLSTDEHSVMEPLGNNHIPVAFLYPTSTKDAVPSLFRPIGSRP